MEQNKTKLKTDEEKSAAEEDLLFLKSMMTYRAFQYESVDLNISKLEAKRTAGT